MKMFSERKQSALDKRNDLKEIAEKRKLAQLKRDFLSQSNDIIKQTMTLRITLLFARRNSLENVPQTWEG